MLKNRLINIFPQNPVQTRYLRFLTTPQGKIKTSFTDAVERFEKSMEEHKTIYDKYFGEI